MGWSTGSKRGSRWLGAAAVVALVVAAPAAGDEAKEDPCARERWLLSGAASQGDGGRAAFIPEWNPTLEAVAACLASERLAEACLVVRGLTDRTDFTPPLARAFGSPEAVQLARGQGRALAVEARLQALGVPATRLRITATAVGTKERGVELTLVRGCLAGVPATLGRAEVEAIVDARVAKALAVHEEATERPAVAAAPAPERPPPAPAPRNPGAPARPWWLDGALDLTVLGFDPAVVLAPVVSVGAGHERRGVLVHLGAGLEVGTKQEERLGVEASARVGGRLSAALELAGEVRYRLASRRLSDPWLDQALVGGVRGTLCPSRLAGRAARVCASAAALPVGVRWRRGEVRGGEAVRLPTTTDWAALFLAGVEVRWPGAAR